MRFLPLLVLLFTGASAAVPPALKAALDAFRTEPPAGWSFTQTSTGGGKSSIERCDAAKPEFERWSLVQQDGRPPTEDETRRYNENRSRRSRGGTAPKLTDQFDLAAAETLADNAERATYRCPLKRTDPGDKTAEFLRATIVFHKPTRTIESLELGSAGEFKPTFGVTVSEMRTSMTYSLPTAEAPSLPQKVTVRMRGRAFLLKSLDADMTVSFADYAKVRP